ncbi:hypothetical protein A9Q81_04085 [Gammaproteobacteria bacterium 42_54_T18]|nr:hypothetical protein A9Q81_04085 [Gammaproteobacteria bacterium 42_54_T18]
MDTSKHFNMQTLFDQLGLSSNSKSIDHSVQSKRIENNNISKMSRTGHPINRPFSKKQFSKTLTGQNFLRIGTLDFATNQPAIQHTLHQEKP